MPECICHCKSCIMFDLDMQMICIWDKSQDRLVPARHLKTGTPQSKHWRWRKHQPTVGTICKEKALKQQKKALLKLERFKTSSTLENPWFSSAADFNFVAGALILRCSLTELFLKDIFSVRPSCGRRRGSLLNLLRKSENIFVRKYHHNGRPERIAFTKPSWLNRLNDMMVSWAKCCSMWMLMSLLPHI